MRTNTNMNDIQDLNEHSWAEISVIIPVFNRPKQLYNCLAALKNQSVLGEIIVVDDHSTQNLEKVCKKFDTCMDLTYLRLRENHGPAFARNVGIETSSYKCVAFTDSDCIPSPDWLEKMYIHLQRSPHYVAGVGGRIVGANNDIFSRYMVYHQILEPHPREFPYKNQYYYLVTANCGYKKDLVLKVEGFDNAMQLPGGEDVGLGLKLLKQGYQLHMADDQIVKHDFRLSLRKFLKTFTTYGKGSAQQVKSIFD